MSDDVPAPPPPLRFGFAGAGIFTVAAWTGSICGAAPFLGWGSLTTAFAVGTAVGFGGIGTLLARRLPPPAALRIGLRGFAVRLLPALALLIPAALLASEIDNLVKAFWPAAPGAALPAAPEPGAGLGEPGPAPGGEAASAWRIAEAAIAMVLLRPVVEEFFFRGVLLQGLVERHGAWLGVMGAALLSALSDAGFNLPLGSAVAASALAQGLFQGALLGGVRLATGSLLAPILLQAATRGIGGLAVLGNHRWPIPGFNAPGDHTPTEFLAPAALAVGLGCLWLARSSGDARGDEMARAATAPVNPLEKPSSLWRRNCPLWGVSTPYPCDSPSGACSQ